MAINYLTFPSTCWSERLDVHSKQWIASGCESRMPKTDTNERWVFILALKVNPGMISGAAAPAACTRLPTFRARFSSQSR